MRTLKKLTLRMANLDCHSDLESYQKSLYQVFCEYPASRFEGMWQVYSEQQQIVTNVAYSGQCILFAEYVNELIGALSINMDMTHQLQAEMMGFTIPNKNPTTAEVLVLFSTKTMVGRDLVVAKLIESAQTILHQHGIKHLWATCRKKHLRGYLSLGFSNRNTVIFNGEERFLLALNL